MAPGQAASMVGLQGPGQTRSPRHGDGPGASAGHPLLHVGSTAAWWDVRQSSRAGAQAPPQLQTQSLDVTRATDSLQKFSVAIRGWS